MISKFLQILGLQPRISKVSLDHQNNFFSQQVRTILVTKYHFQGICPLFLTINYFYFISDTMEDPITPIEAILQRCPQQQMCLQYNITTYTNVNEFLGTIHILRKHFQSTKLNLTTNFSQKLCFFIKTKEFLFQHYILTKNLCCSLNF